ncbi:hypothetical protein BaRGS_00014930 [Batillaria attramentaria]|uniref:Sodium-dependent phosphate transport protein 2B n=1 Tax=Batillaria attramentaria TaxID=370345 RepID=A0ABD0L313_9CAEN
MSLLMSLFSHSLQTNREMPLPEKPHIKSDKKNGKVDFGGEDTVAWKGLLEDSFQLLGGKAAGKTFQNNELLHNPVTGLMIGVLATVLVQSSSTSTSIVITMVGSGIIKIDVAIPIIMGANIGTSVTNTIVSLAQAGDREEFRRAFSGATVHDMFNWLTVLILLPLEVTTHYLHALTGAIVSTMPSDGNGTDSAPDMLKAITKPFTKLIVEVDKDVIEKTASAGRPNSTDEPVGDVLLRYCDKNHYVLENVTTAVTNHTIVNCDDILSSQTAQTSRFYGLCQEVKGHPLVDSSQVDVSLTWDAMDLKNVSNHVKRCDNLFAQTDLDDSAVGAILLVCSLIIIFLALFCIVKILHSLLHGSLAKVIRKTINADLPGKCAYFTGYIAILVGCGLTMVLQSSSVFTSTLTPLVGVGVVSVERMYPLTLGANIGTTVTGILAALSQSGVHLKSALQVALCHLFFNISGIVIFYPLPFMRWPIGMAKTLGRTTAKYRWFAIMYLILVFIVIPGAVFGLSVAGTVYLGAIGGSFLFVFLVAIIINALQRKRPGVLPPALRSWGFLPSWMHSLKPVDMVVVKVCRCGCCRKLQAADLGDSDVQEVVIVSDEDVVDSTYTSANTPAGLTSSSDTSSDSGVVSNGAVRDDYGALNGQAFYDNKGLDIEEHRL